MDALFPRKKTPPRLAEVIRNPALRTSSARKSCKPSAFEAWYSKTSGLKIALFD
jgi:hypothetical protein